MATEENKEQVGQAEIDDQVKEQKLSEEELECVSGGAEQRTLDPIGFRAPIK